MPTNHDESPLQRQERDHQSYLAMLAKMTPEQIAGLELQLHNALAECERLREAMEGHVLVTGERIERHATTAWECPPQSRVILVSSLQRWACNNASSLAGNKEPSQ